MALFASDKKLIESLTECLSYVAQYLKAPVSVVLWDGSQVALGDVSQSKLTITLSQKGVILNTKPVVEKLLAKATHQ